MLNSNALRVIEGSVAADIDAQWRAAKGHVYYIGCAETFRLKIGFTAGDTSKRLRALQTGSPTRLTVLSIIPGTMEMEKALHARFARERVHGEWFEMSPRLFEHLEYVAWFYHSGAEPSPDNRLLQFGREALEAVERDRQDGRK